jgi:hypothetical protein
MFIACTGFFMLYTVQVYNLFTPTACHADTDLKKHFNNNKPQNIKKIWQNSQET